MDGRANISRVPQPKSAPDAWEKRTLEEFDAAKSTGADVTKLERFEVVEKAGVRTFRFMKTIPVAEPCLACHGEAIKEPVAAKLKELYPDDRATGYKVGDIRGASLSLSRRNDVAPPVFLGRALAYKRQ